MINTLQQKYLDAARGDIPVYKFPLRRIDNIRHKVMMIFYEYNLKIDSSLSSRGFGATSPGQALKATSHLTLPVPIKVNEKYDVQYSTINAADLVMQGVNVRAQAAAKTEAKMKQSGFGTAAAQWGDFAKAGVGAAMAATGYAFNPYTLLQLKGVNLRRHNFRWKLHPETREDTYAVENIIRTLRLKMHPELLAGDLVLQYPEIMNFRVFGASEPDHVYPTAPCVIESVLVDRTGGDYPSYFAETGTPVVYGIQLNLIEILPMYRRGDQLDAAGVPFFNSGGIVDWLVTNKNNQSRNSVEGAGNDGSIEGG